MSALKESHVEETLDAVHVAGATVEGARFEGCTLTDWTASASTLRGCVFEECVLRGCDLSNAKLYDTRLRGVRFERCKLMGVDFTAAYALGFDVAFEGCVLSYASFAAMALRGLQMIGCRAHEALFDDADLRDACFDESDLRGSRFGGADLRGADLSEATGYVIDPEYTKVKGAKMSVEGAVATAQAMGIEVPNF
jgi:fluoroquinolone resistance protein